MEEQTYILQTSDVREILHLCEIGFGIKQNEDSNLIMKLERKSLDQNTTSDNCRNIRIAY